MTADEIATHLETAGLGTIAASTGTGIFVGQYPTAPDSVIAIRETGGISPEFTQDDQDPFVVHPQVQVITRGPNSSSGYDFARAKAQSVNTVLRRVTNQTLSGVLYHRVTPIQEPAYLGSEEGTEREMWVINFEIDKDSST
jgi:hypothetical protein